MEIKEILTTTQNYRIDTYGRYLTVSFKITKFVSFGNADEKFISAVYPLFFD